MNWLFNPVKFFQDTYYSYLSFQRSSELNKIDSQGQTLLHHACINGEWEEVEKLVRIKEVNLDLQDRDGCTPLHLACIHGHVKCVQQLVEHSAELSLQDHKGYTPLHYTTEQGTFQCAQLLLQCQCQNLSIMLQIRCKDGCTPLVMADKNKKTILHHACEEGDFVLVKNLVTAGAVSNAQDFKGYTPLHNACGKGHFEVAQYLIVQCHKPLTMLQMQCGDGRTPLKMTDQNKKTILHHACLRGNFVLVKTLVTAGAVSNTQDVKGYTPLHYACKNGHLQVVQYFMFQCQNLDMLQIKCKNGCTPLVMKDYYCRTILHHACVEGNYPLVEKLVTAGADCSRQDVKGYTPLYYACTSGHFEVARYLIDQCQNPLTVLQVSGKDKNGMTILHYACAKAYVLLVESVVIAGGVSGLQDAWGYTPLHYACENGHFQVAQYLISTCQNQSDELLIECKDGRTPPMMVDESRKTMLHHACEEGDVVVVEKLVTAGADVIAQDVKGYTPLHYACETGHLQVVQYLQNLLHCEDQLAILLIQCKDGRTPAVMADKNRKTMLHHACEKGDAPLVKNLVTAGATCIAQDVKGYTPLHYACENGQFKVAQCLIVQCQNLLTMLQIECQDACTPLVMADKNKKTILHHACEKGDFVLVKSLIIAGADIIAQDVKGYTPLHYACENDHFQVAHYLTVQCHNQLNMCQIKCDYGRTLPKMTDKNRKTMLHHSCENGNILLVEKLVAAGADLNAQDVQGYTPIHYACEKGRVELVEKLVKLNADINARDNRGWTPIMTVVHNLSGKEEQEEIMKSLLSSKVKCNLDTKDYKTEDTALHLACTKGNSTCAQLLLSNGADVDCRNSARCTPLHVACRLSQYHGSDDSCAREIIFLLTSHHCDVTAKDMFGKTALHYSAKCQHHSIPLSLITAGCDITAKDSQGKHFSDLAPPSLMQKVKKELLSFERRQIVCVIGHPKSGKSTLIAALEGNQVETGWFYKCFLKPRLNTNKVKSRTAGIEVKKIHGQSLQCVILFDFAGQAEYYSSHLAFLESALSGKGTAVTFIMMTDLRCTEKERFDQCMEWLFPIKCILEEHNQLVQDVLLIGSHLDRLSIRQRTYAISSLGSISDKLTQSLHCGKVNFVDHWGMDCRKLSSSGISKLKHYFQYRRRQRLRDVSTSKVPLAACVLFNKLRMKSLNLSISVDDIAQKLEDDKPPFPLTQEFIDGLCQELASSGLGLYIRDELKLNMGRNLLILNIGEVLTHIHGKLFAPNSSEFPMHHKNLANKFGLVHKSELESAFKDSPLKTDMIEKLLIAMEFCHPVDTDLLNSEISQLFGTTEPRLLSDNSGNWLYFPSLVSTDPPKQKLFDEKQSESCPWMCWELQTIDPHYFNPRFQQALFVRLGAKYVHHQTDDKQTETIDCSCQVWKNGMSWSHRSGVHICIEIKQKCVVQIQACGRPDLELPRMEPVINLISDVAQEVHIVKEHHSRGVSTTSCLRKVVRGSPFESGCSVLVNDLICAVKENRMHVNLKEGAGLIAIREFLHDWNPYQFILEKMVLAKKSQDERIFTESSPRAALTSSQPQQIPTLNLNAQSGTASSQSTREGIQLNAHCEKSGLTETSKFKNIITSTGAFLPFMDKMLPHLRLLGTVLNIEDYAVAILDASGNPKTKCLHILKEWVDRTSEPTLRLFCDQLARREEFITLISAICKEMENDPKPRRSVRSKAYIPTDVHKYLWHLQSRRNWADFREGASEIWQKEIIQKAIIPIAEDSRKEMQEDTRLRGLKEVPSGYTVGRSTGDGNCFYNSVSLVMQGDEDKAPWLRLGSAVWAALHIEHYFETFSACFQNAQEAFSFANEVCSDTILAKWPSPCDWSKGQILRQALQEEAMATVSDGRYCGKLQIHFTAGLLSQPIRMTCEGSWPGFEGTITPCSCFGQDLPEAIEIMWVANRETVCKPNHIVPLIPKQVRFCNTDTRSCTEFVHAMV